MAPSSECPTCALLLAERDHLKRIYDLAAANLKLAGDNASRYQILTTVADGAKSDLDTADAWIMHHQDWHATADKGSHPFVPAP